MRARYYQAETLRFTSRDTWRGDEFRPRGYNRFGYVYGNVVNWTDPTGLDCSGIKDIGSQNMCRKGEAAAARIAVTAPVRTASKPSDCAEYGQLDFYASADEAKKSVRVGRKFTEALSQYPGWWNSYSKGSMSIKMPLTVMIYLEGSLFVNPKHDRARYRYEDWKRGQLAFAEAVSRRFWDACIGYGSSSCSINDRASWGANYDNVTSDYGPMYFLGSRQVFRDRLTIFEAAKKLDTGIGDFASTVQISSDYFQIWEARRIAEMVLHPVAEASCWACGVYQGRPYDWGNITQNNPSSIQNWAGQTNNMGTENNQVFYTSGSTVGSFYVMTPGQSSINCEQPFKTTCVKATTSGP